MKTLANNRYQILDKIASTPVSTVYKARDTIENRPVAVKIVLSDDKNEQELMVSVARLRHEAGILSGLNHPNIIPLYNVGVHEGQVYLVLPLLEGHSLDSEIGGGKKINFRRAADIAMQVADALSYVHAKKILHLDIKPGNIFILPGEKQGECRVILLDFGFSRLLSLILREKPGEMVGTAAYMSPEQTGVLGQPVDQRSDLYSLGIVLYQMTTGCLPLVARDLPTLLHKQVAEEPIPPTRIVPSLPRPLEEIILKLLRKEPGERYLTAEGLKEDLAYFIRLVDRGQEDQVFTLQRKEKKGWLNLDPQIRGRDRELQVFEQMLVSLPSSGGDIIFLSGDPGIGKTRLGQEFLKIGLKRQMLLVAAQCSPGLKEQPCQLLLDMLAALVETLNSYPKEYQFKLLEGLKNQGKNYEDFNEVISELLRTWRRLSDLPHVNPTNLQKDIFSKLYTFLEAIANETNGIIMFIDNIHWADDGSLYFLNYLVENSINKPILLIATLCPGQVYRGSMLGNLIAGLQLNHPSFTNQQLLPLDFEQNEHTLAEILRTAPEKISPDVSQYIFKATGGNPLFLIEYIKSAIEIGILILEQDIWKLVREPRIRDAMPRTLAEILANRLGRLKPEMTEVLQIASILGLRFTLDALKHLSGKKAEELFPIIDEVRDAQMIMERGTMGGGGYMFAHQQIMDTVYNSMDSETRRRLHEKAGSILEEKSSSALDRVAFELSKHFYLGYSHNKAFRYSLLSADLARSRCSFREVVLFLERALTLFPSYESEELSKLWLDIHIKLGETCYRLSMYDKAVSCFQEAIRYSPDARQTALLRSYIGSICFRKGNFQDALRYHEQALQEYGYGVPRHKFALITRSGYWVALLSARVFLSNFFKRKKKKSRDDFSLIERIRLFSQTSYVCFFLGDLSRALWCNLRQLNMAQKLGESEHLAQAFDMHGLLCSQIGLFPRAEKFIEKSRKINEKLVSRSWGIAQCLSYLGYCLMNQGRSREAVSKLVESVEIWKSVGDPLELGYALRYLAWSYIFIGDLHRAASTFTELAALAEKMEDRRAVTDAWNGRTLVSVMMGELDLAIEYGSQALAVSNSPELLNPRAVAHQILGRAYHCKGDLQRAEMELEESRILIEKHKLVPTMQSLTYAYLAELYLSDKDKLASFSDSEKNAQLEKIHRLCRQGIKQAGRIKRNRAENLRSLALYYEQIGKDRKVQSCFTAAEQILQSQGYRFELARTYRFHGKFLLTKNRGLAIEYLERALSLFKDMAATYEVKITREIMGEELEEKVQPASEAAPSRMFLSDASTFESLLELYRQVTSVLELDKLLVKIVDLANQAVGAERGFLLLQDQGKLEVKVARNSHKKSISSNKHEISWGIVHKVAAGQFPILVANAQTQEELQEKDSIRAYGLRSVACVPVTFKKKFLGVIYVDNRFARGLFTERELNLLHLFASQAAVALENAVMYEKVKEDEERISEENRYLKRDFALQHHFSNIIAEDSQMQSILNQVEQIAPTEANVLLQGETGTGKGIIARAVHSRSLRADGVFIEQNCAALPENLLESELFGYKKGAFTGAVSDKKGILEAADQATFFLDEIAEATPAIQAKLLRVIEGQTFRRLGDTVERKVDVRIIAATNRDLTVEIKSGRFRSDLYYRLNTVKINLPPLRKRKDKKALAYFFLDKYDRAAQKQIKGFTAEAMEAIEKYSFPGNIRELENVIQRAVLMTDPGQPIGPASLFPEILPAENGAGGSTSPSGSLPLNVPLKEAVGEFEKKYIQAVLDECGGKVSKAAAKMGISRYGLYKKIQKLIPEGVET
ncbi:MAG: sigma 54-interacting transcriptional regulator [PVC group bacterium]